MNAEQSELEITKDLNIDGFSFLWKQAKSSVTQRLLESHDYDYWGAAKELFLEMGGEYSKEIQAAKDRERSAQIPLREEGFPINYMPYYNPRKG